MEPSIPPMPDQISAIIVDGFLIDPVTGEVLGHVDQREEFHVSDLASAEWVLEKMQSLDSEVAGLEMRLQAVSEQIGAMIADRRRRREWLEKRFEAELEAFAARELADRKERSLKTPFGTLSFRKQPVRIAIREGVQTTDSCKAGESHILPPLVDWAMVYHPESVKKTVAFQISQLPKGLGISDVDGDLPAEFFEEIPESQTFYVTTGVVARRSPSKSLASEIDR